MSVLHIWENFALNYSCNVKKKKLDHIRPVGCFGGKEKKIKNLSCRVRCLPQQIRMHNHKVVKDEIKPWNYFQLDFVTESDPLWVLPPEFWQESCPCPEAKVNLACTPITSFLHSPRCLIHFSFISWNTHTSAGIRVDGRLHRWKEVIQSCGISFTTG